VIGFAEQEHIETVVEKATYVNRQLF